MFKPSNKQPEFFSVSLLKASHIRKAVEQHFENCLTMNYETVAFFSAQQVFSQNASSEQGTSRRSETDKDEADNTLLSHSNLFCSTEPDLAHSSLTVSLARLKGFAGTRNVTDIIKNCNKLYIKFLLSIFMPI